jgi:A/G-specific adenine glycosylase
MLQQTRVETVIPYYRNFLKQFPTLNVLADASRNRVMKAWEGMGYYSRIRNLHDAAKEIVQSDGGKVPNSFEELMRLPGIGRTTAGAILSFAFYEDEPILDGNVKRVLSRVFRIEKNPLETAAKNELWQLSENLIPKGKGYLFNQAIMELGATVCLPRNPKCSICPLKQLCLAKRFNLQDSLPVKMKKKPLPHYDIATGIIWRGKEVLISLRPQKGLLGGLWEFPGGKKEKGETLEECLKREIREELGLKIRVKEPFMNVNHAYSHFKITLHTFHCEVQKGKPDLKVRDTKEPYSEDWRWVGLRDLNQYAFPAANRKIIEELLRTNSPRRK